tara:strand:+ start:234 stop:752 length:519 start_codon:yes stop_codon:yes gene_type:complete
MNTLFGVELWRPITKYGIIIPHYFVSYDGRVFSTRTKKHKILNPKYDTKDSRSKYLMPRHVGCRVDRSKSPELFAEYNYHNTNPSTKNVNLISINVLIHRAVMEAWKPIDKFPPIPKEDWDICPESAKQFIKESAIIDHIDGDTRNNHGDNLRWITPKQNHYCRKNAKLTAA